MPKYIWTNHAKFKMNFYNLSKNRIKRTIRSPIRTEEGIAPNTIAVMQPSSYKNHGKKKTWTQEIWVMYVIKKEHKKNVKLLINNNKIKVISAWRYPGVTKPKEKLPEKIISEIKEALYSFN